jgi:hypothetical protein
MRSARAIVLAALLALAVSAPVALAAKIRVKQSRVTLRLPRPGHRAVTHHTGRLPRGLRAYFAYVQIVDARGRRTAKAGPGQPLIFARPDGTKVYSLTLSARYRRRTGAVRLGLKLENIAGPKGAAVKAVVTIGYRR